MQKILLIVTMLALTGCATYEPPVDSGVANTKAVSKSFDDVWSKATEWFANNNVPIKNIVKDSGLIATDYRLGTNATFIDCGKVGTYEAFGDKSLNINFIAKKVSALETDVRLNVFGTARVETADLYGRSTGAGKTIDCVSTGSLETALFDYISN